MAKSKVGFAAFFARWKSGESLTTLFREAAANGFAGKKGKFRRAIQAEAGGKEKFKQLRDDGAGGKAEPFGGKRAAPGPKLDDSKVKVITPKGPRLKGWHFRLLRESKKIKVKLDGEIHEGIVSAPKEMIYISPSGNEYVKATDAERADLIIQYLAKHGSPLGDCRIRFKKFESSRVAKQLDQHEKDLERGEAALKRIRKEKRAKKLARKNAKKGGK